MEAIACGVSTRNYPRTLDPMAPSEREVAISSSAVSRRFVAMSAAIVSTYLSRPLDTLELRVIMIDGIVFSDHTILIALGVSAGAEKIVLGVREGTTENAGVVKALLSDLIERGLSTEKPIVFVIDGAKGLRSAIVGLFGKLALVQRCQVHKLRNVLDHLPEALKPGTQRAMREAYDCADADIAQRRLEQVARSLDREHPGAAASLREGLADTLTLSRLKVGGALYRSLRSTNLIENLNGSVAHFARNVRRWRGGAMIVRWVATAVREAEKKFRRLKGYKEMPQLLAALDAYAPSQPLDMRRKAA
jgi:transposase-like protein